MTSFRNLVLCHVLKMKAQNMLSPIDFKSCFYRIDYFSVDYILIAQLLYKPMILHKMLSSMCSAQSCV